MIQSPAPLDELLTVDDAAALLKVSKSWVYEHTRTRRLPHGERLPCLKLGKHVRLPATVGRRRRLVREALDQLRWMAAWRRPAPGRA
jgi:excisionase family DNA binding protein